MGKKEKKVIKKSKPVKKGVEMKSSDLKEKIEKLKKEIELQHDDLIANGDSVIIAEARIKATKDAFDIVLKEIEQLEKKK